MSRKKVLAICGSTKSTSINLVLIEMIASMFEEFIDLEIYRDIALIPHFNPELDNNFLPDEVTMFRQKIKDADGVLISTPEYAMGVPGSLKNAIDWTVSSCEFSHKPVALITASSQGMKGHASLLETLHIIECNLPEKTQLLISFVKTKIKPDHSFADAQTKEHVVAVINELSDLMNNSPTVG